ncbi:MAG: D-amino-acid transaminase [Parvularculaceae bacterium]|jgi:D-alanine transaminase|nr:D-amino-acid transaminase [Parvularculaceae bacterium]
MPRIAYVNGRYVRQSEAAVHIEDRGYQFADGVYEVCLVIGGAYWDEEGHLDRLDRSLRELEISPPMSRSALKSVLSAVVRRNRLKNALVYLQVTRGVAPRNHAFPNPPVPASLVVTAKPFDLEKCEAQAEKGVAVVTQPDIRWGRVDIKTIGLLPNALAKEFARREGASEAWLVRDGKVTEGAASNAWIVTKSGEVVTHPLGDEILGGVTRQTVIACAEELQIKISERPFSLKEVAEATELFLTSASNLVMPIVKIDGREVGRGAPGPVARRLREAYLKRCALTPA